MLFDSDVPAQQRDSHETREVQATRFRIRKSAVKTMKMKMTKFLQREA